jgi:hypothetical protein
MSDEQETTYTVRSDVGFSWYFRKTVVNKIHDPTTKRIAEEQTVEASLGGHSDLFDLAKRDLETAQREINSRLASER